MKKYSRILAMFSLIIFVFSTFSIYGCSLNKDENRTFYEIECTLEQDKLTGKEKVVFFNSSSNAFNCIKFNLYANAFRQGAQFSPIANQYLSQSYYNGINYGSEEILQVKVAEKSVKFETCGADKNILAVYLDKEIYPQEKVEIEIDYVINLAKVIARTGINLDTINLANFYPIICGIQNDSFYECVYYSTGDPYFSDYADYKVTLNIDSKYVVASSGRLEQQTTKNNLTTYVYSLQNARSFSMVVSEKFQVLTKEICKIEVNYFYYKDQDPQASMKTIEKSLNYFINTFGNYPYSHYSVVQTKFVQGGMEFPALVMISDSLENQAYQEVIVHETAHQWWQTVVGNNEIEFAFLDEGLAEYSVVLFYENHQEYGLTRQNVIESARKTYKSFCTVYDKIFGGVDTTMVRPLKNFKSEYEYVNLTYIKSCIMYDVLRTTIGDKKFFNGLRKYYSDYSFSNAQPSDLVGVFEKIGSDTNGFFQSFFEGKVIL